MTNEERRALSLLGELLVQIRGIAGDAAKFGHTSNLGAGQFNAENACVAIYELTNSAHALPECLADSAKNGSHFLMRSTMRNISSTGIQVFGHRSPFDKYVSDDCM